METFDTILQKLRPGADYSNPDSTLANVRWGGGVIPPTQQEFDAAVVALNSPPPAAAERALQIRRADKLAASPSLDDKIEGLNIRIKLLGG